MKTNARLFTVIVREKRKWACIRLSASSLSCSPFVASNFGKAVTPLCRGSTSSLHCEYALCY